jgi:hypothetical protein
MAQIPLLSGIFSDATSQLRTAYPRNLVPVPTSSGISTGYLAPAPGIQKFGDGPGVDRGGINWNGQLYRAMGTKLVRIDSSGGAATLGDIGSNDKPVSFDYSFDRLAVASNTGLFYWDGFALTQVTDPDLGVVIDMIWVDGYFMTTDGEFIVVTELNDPYSVNPLKYGSSEADPDPIVALKRIRTEVMALNRYTIEQFQNIGGNNFPFQRIDGAMIQKGCVGTHACCNFSESIAFLGSGRNEAPGIYFALSGNAQKVSTREIDVILATYSENQLSKAVLESKTSDAHKHLLVHLPDQTLVFDASATEALGTPVWFVLTSGVVGPATYRARFHVWVYDDWIVGDTYSPQTGRLVGNISTHYGDAVGWEFGTPIMYTEGTGAVIHDLELVALPGDVAFGASPVIWTSYSLDGQTWSQERPTNAGKAGETQKRICWRRLGHFRNWRIQKFRGTSDAHLSLIRIEIRFEKLNG